MEEHISEEASDSKGNQIVKKRLLDPGRTQEKDIQSVDKEYRDD